MNQYKNGLVVNVTKTHTKRIPLFQNLNGKDVKNKNALANPDCLKEYQNIYQELKKG